MKKILLSLVPAMLAAGCARQIELAEPESMTDNRETVPELKTRSLEGAVYNEVVDAWMIPQADPYTLENFQNAYDKLAAGKAAQTLSRAQAAEFAAAKKLAPTHYALKIYPHNEEEQWRVEMMEDVQVSYIPFDYAQLTLQEVEKLPQAQTKTRSAADTFAEKSPYTVTYVYSDDSYGGPTGPVTYQLPILYTVWPVSKSLPDDLEYVIDYDVFLPYTVSGKSISEETLRVLWSEAVPDIPIISTQELTRLSTRAPAMYIWPLTGSVYSFDNTVGTDVPMANLKVRFQNGSFISDTYTDSYGRFNISYQFPIPWYPRTGMGAVGNLTFTYQDPQGRWKITTGGTTPLSRVLNSVSFMEPPIGDVYNLHALIKLSSGANQENEIHRAVNYFFNGQTIFPKNVLSGGVKIIANSGPHSGGADGGFAPASRDIFIYKNGNNPHGFVIGVTLHEIGHYIDCYNNSTRMLNSPLFLSEAFSGYVGWFLAHEYYRTQGKTAAPGEDLTDNYKSGSARYGNARQEWDKYSSNIYTPLFVDLTDNYNQRTVSYPNRPNDNITNVPASVIWSTITSINSWAQCRSKLQSYSGTGTGKYYTTVQFTEWIDAFDYNPYIY